MGFEVLRSLKSLAFVWVTLSCTFRLSKRPSCIAIRARSDMIALASKELCGFLRRLTYRSQGFDLARKRLPPDRINRCCQELLVGSELLKSSDRTGRSDDRNEIARLHLLFYESVKSSTSIVDAAVGHGQVVDYDRDRTPC